MTPQQTSVFPGQNENSMRLRRQLIGQTQAFIAVRSGCSIDVACPIKGEPGIRRLLLVGESVDDVEAVRCSRTGDSIPGRNNAISHPQASKITDRSSLPSVKFCRVSREKIPGLFHPFLTAPTRREQRPPPSLLPRSDLRLSFSKWPHMFASYLARR